MFLLRRPFIYQELLDKVSHEFKIVKTPQHTNITSLIRHMSYKHQQREIYFHLPQAQVLYNLRQKVGLESSFVNYYHEQKKLHSYASGSESVPPHSTDDSRFISEWLIVSETSRRHPSPSSQLWVLRGWRPSNSLALSLLKSSRPSTT